MKKRLFLASLFILNSLCLFSCNPVDPDMEEPGHYVDPDNVEIPSESFHSKAQIAYLSDSWSSIADYANGTEEMSIPYGNVFKYEDKTAKYMQISSKSDYSDYRLFDITGLEQARIRNLYSDTTYYWRTFASNDFTVVPLEEGTLKTDNVLPRNCYIAPKDSTHYVTNVRDLGGYTSSLGGKLKQGMMYRGGRLSGGLTIDYTYDGEGNLTKIKRHSVSVCYSDEGYNQMTKILGIKHEVDLREAEESPTMGTITLNDGSKKEVKISGHIENGDRANNPNIIPGITCHTISINSYETSFMAGSDGKNDGKEYIKEFFRICAEPTNFPMYIHCYIGTDRTGCLCYLAEAVLGVDSESLVRDYLFSNFGLIGGSRDPYAIRKIYEPILNSFNKPSLAENAEAYLLSIGVTQAQINSFRNTMLIK